MKTALRRLLAACSLLLTPILAFGQSRGVVEGKAASGNTIFISTPAASRQVDVNTSTTVPGAVLVSSGPAVLISTSVNSSIPPLQIRNETNTPVSSMTRTGDVYITGSVYKNGTAGQTLTCGTNQFVSLFVSSGGVLLAGSCVTAATIAGANIWSGTNSFPAGTVSLTAPTFQMFTSGSGTYTRPTNAVRLTTRMCAGGGGGAVSAGAGGATYFGTIVASSGTAGGSTCQAGAGGSGGAGGFGVFTSSTVIRSPGNGGTCGIDAASIQGGSGGGSAFFGGGAPGVQSVLVNGIANSGGGGSGNPTLDGTSSGGGGGECVEINITSPASSYPYSVGAGGTAGTGGGAGGSGLIVVYEYYY